MGKSEMERKGNFAPSYLSFPVPFRPFQINPAFLSLSEKNGQLSGKGNIAFLSLTCMNKNLKKLHLEPKFSNLRMAFVPFKNLLRFLQKKWGKH